MIDKPIGNPQTNSVHRERAKQPEEERGAIGSARWGIERRYGQWLWWAENPMTKHGMRSGGSSRKDAIKQATAKAQELNVSA